MPPKKLDSGGQGQIYEVDKDTVYKVIKFSNHYKEISELSILHSLSHPCMIRMKRWELTRNECKIYMERMHSNMYEYAKKTTFEKRLELFPQIFWTMVRVARFFQRNGIMNCDIKSENVMLSKDGHTVKIIDFGHMILDEEYPIIGTRSYQPPELWIDDQYSNKSMVWSIGMSALEFLYRIHPIVDIIYGDDSESDTRSSSKSNSNSYSNSYSYSNSDSYTSGSSTDSDDEYRVKYTNLFELLMEEGDSLPFRHRLDQPPEHLKDKLRVINTMLERMLTYERTKRISLDELYNHRIFDNLRGDIKDEPILTKTHSQLFCDKELTSVFMSLGRKLYREEIMYQAYMLLSTYLEKRQKPSLYEFMLTSLACLDIMSYTFSMVPSSRDMYRSVILSLRKISEDQIFDRVIEILKAVHFNIFFHGLIDTIKANDKNVLYPLVLELMELQSETGKKQILQEQILDKYLSSELLNGTDDDSSSQQSDHDSESDTSEPDVHNTEPDLYVPTEQKAAVNVKRTPTRKPVETKSDAAPVSEPPKADTAKPKREKKNIVIQEYDLDPVFLQTFKEQIRNVHKQELLKKQEEEQRGDLLIIEL
jgi:serine/threonine protein kinase